MDPQIIWQNREGEYDGPNYDDGYRDSRSDEPTFVFDGFTAFSSSFLNSVPVQDIFTALQFPILPDILVDSEDRTTFVNPFAVGSSSSNSSQVFETENNNTIETANLINRSDFRISTDVDFVNSGRLPHVTVLGDISSNNDVDFYKFLAVQGESFTFDIDRGSAFGNSVDTQLHIFSSDGVLLTSNDDASTSLGGAGSTSGLDAFLEFTATTTDFLVVAVSSFDNDGSTGGVFDNRGFSSGDYELNISFDIGGVQETQTSNDSIGRGQILQVEEFSTSSSLIVENSTTIAHNTISGNIASNNDVDFYNIALRRGEVVTLDTDFGQGAGDSVDTQLHVFDSTSALLASNDDASTLLGGAGSISALDSFLTFTANRTGTHSIAVSSFNNDGAAGGGFSGRGFSSGDYLLNISVNESRFETEGNDSIATADILLESSFSTDTSNPDVGNIRGSGSVPYLTLRGDISTNDDVDFYQLETRNNEIITLDIDSAFGFRDSVDTQIHVFGPDGSLITSNDDAATFLGGGGSVSSFDSFASFTTVQAGNHFFAISSFNNDASSGGVFNGRGSSDGDYVLNITRQSGLSSSNSNSATSSTTVSDINSSSSSTLSLSDEARVAESANTPSVFQSSIGSFGGSPFSVQAGPTFGLQNTISIVAETEPNSSQLLADSLSRSSFVRVFDSNVVNSTRDPHVTVLGDINSNNDVDFFSVTLFPGEGLIADIDFGQGSGDSVDTQVTIFSPNGSSFRINDDASTSLGGAGSVSVLDSFLDFPSVLAGGNFVIAVSSFNNDPALNGTFNFDNRGFSSGDYTLQLSITSSADPLVLDLSGDGIALPGFGSNRVLFDMNGDGECDETYWITGDDAFLAMDVNGNGLVDGIQELFSEYFSIGAESGFSAILELDHNSDGKLDSDDALWGDIVVWRDVNVDGRSEPSEISSLRQYDISSISLGNNAETEGHESDQVSASIVGSTSNSSGEEWMLAEIEFHQIDFAQTGVG